MVSLLLLNLIQSAVSGMMVGLFITGTMWAVQIPVAKRSPRKVFNVAFWVVFALMLVYYTTL